MSWSKNYLESKLQLWIITYDEFLTESMWWKNQRCQDRAWISRLEVGYIYRLIFLRSLPGQAQSCYDPITVPAHFTSGKLVKIDVSIQIGQVPSCLLNHAWSSTWRVILGSQLMYKLAFLVKVQPTDCYWQICSLYTKSIPLVDKIVHTIIIFCIHTSL